MENISYYQFCKTIADDFGIELNQKVKTPISKFPLKDGKRKIHSSYDAVIVDKDGIEHPYMISQFPAIRNNEKLIDFDYLYTIRPKGLEQIIKETGVKLSSQKCQISEGGGWYSQGTKYFYNDITCEV